MGFCDAGGGCKTGTVITGGGNVPTRGPGVVGREVDDGGGGMRKGMTPDEDGDDVDDIRAMGNEGV